MLLAKDSIEERPRADDQSNFSSGRITQQQLESYLWGAAVLLRGTIDAGDYKQFIFPLLFYKRLCDVFDEETRFALRESGGDTKFAEYPENHRFQIPRESHWRELRKVAKNVGKAIQSAMRAIEKANPDKLYGIFGDAQWSNKDRLSDAMLRDLVEHFSSLDLTVENLPEDELGNGYEYLIKKFADDSGHTAAEFYTNRTVVHLMTELLQPEPGESIYDPTCGSGGMLLSTIAHLRNQGKEWRNVRLFGQERNLMTSSIARMNCFLHGIEDFRIERGDTLAEPKLVEGDKLMKFDVVLANPPYSIKQWDRDAFGSDPWGRNIFGTPPQGRADYAFWQHIIKSMDPKAGRCAILFPHGVLFRKEEVEMRRKLIDADLIECVIGLGPNLFYNSPMEACVVICRTRKPKNRKNKIQFINAVNEVSRERAQSFLTDEHIGTIISAYRNSEDVSGLSRIISVEEISRNDLNLSIPLYVPLRPNGSSWNTTPQESSNSLRSAIDSFLESRALLINTLSQLELKVPTSEEDLRSTGIKLIPILDRSKWQRIRFGEVVENINETERDPEVAGISRFIGLEHLEPGSLHVTSWGDVALGTTFTRRCRPGQVLFGKRRAYQRKVAVAEFDAVVSGDIYVLAPKNEKLIPELLPFICLSERFFDHAVGTSAGSLSPRTNWSSLASFEFDLPPLEEQKRIAEILWNADELLHRNMDLNVCSNNLKNSVLEELFLDGDLKPITLSQLCGPKGIRIGPFGSQLHAHDYCAEGTAVVMPTNLESDEIIDAHLKRISPDKAAELFSHVLKPGDVLLPRRGDLTKRGYVRAHQNGWICGTGTVRIRATRSEDRRLLFYALSRPSVTEWLERNAVGTTMPNLNLQIITSLQLAWPRNPDKALSQIESLDQLLHSSTATNGSLLRLLSILIGSLI